MHEALGPRAGGSVQRMTGPEHVHAPEALPVALQPDPGRGVYDELGTACCLLPRAPGSQAPATTPNLGTDRTSTPETSDPASR
jgi:hypothetical protein